MDRAAAREDELGGRAAERDVGDEVAEVVTEQAHAEIVRQRRNAAQAIAKGIEIDARQRWRQFTGEASYLFVDTRMSTGPRTPQVPKHQGSAQLSWMGKSTSVSAGVRVTAAQFEDDLNRFVLPGFAVAQFSVRQRLWRSLSAQLVTENLLDRQFVVGFSPTPLIGSPRLVRAGLRWDGRVF